MEKSELAEIIKRAIGEAKRAELGGYEIAPGTNAPPRPDIAMQISHIAMLGEIAYQLAVMNERNALEDERLGDRVEGISLSVTAIEGRLDKLEPPRTICAAERVGPFRQELCGLEKGHSGLHGWNRFRTPDGICPAVSNGHEGPLGCCLADGHDGSHRWGR